MPRNIFPTIMQPSTARGRAHDDFLAREEYWSWIAIPALLWFFVSLCMMMGIYGPKSAVLGPNYSHLCAVNSLFVSYIEVGEKSQAGPMLYGFSARPVLGFRSIWNETRDVFLEANYHQEFGLWLNMGSKLRVTCFIRSSGFYNILLTVSEGYTGLQQWIHDPQNHQAASVWKDVHGQVGDLEYEVKQDGDYFISVGNLDQQSVSIELQLEVNATMYGFDSSKSVCSLGNGACKIKFPLVVNSYVLLSTPLASENGTDSWEVKLSYGVRWVSYFTLLACILLLVSAILKVVNIFCYSSQQQTSETRSEEARSPLLSPKVGATNAESSSDTEIGDDDDTLIIPIEDAHDVHLCAVCLDAPKAVFFIPCGHYATCLACGKRIRHGEPGTCPICRVKIQKIRRVFQA